MTTSVAEGFAAQRSRARALPLLNLKKKRGCSQSTINRYGNPNATQGFIWKKITWPPGLLERKNNNKVVSFSALFFMFTLTWITEKELERVIENNRDEFRRKKNMEIQSDSEKMGNASGQQGENERH